MEHYPDSIPLPLLREGRFKQASNLQTDSMAGGNLKARRRWANQPPTIKEFVWRLTPDQAAFFEGWIKHVLVGALANFQMTIPTPLGRLPHECRLLTDPMEDYAPLSYRLWEYRAQVMVKQREIQDETTTITQYFAPLDVFGLIDDIAEGLVNYLE